MEENTARKMKVFALEMVLTIALALYVGIGGYGILDQVVPNFLGKAPTQLNAAEALILLALVICSFWIMYTTGGMIDELHAAIKEGDSDA